MSIKEVERELRANGFAFYKNARHGEIWRDNYGNTVMRGRDLHGRNLKNLLADISRAVAMRPPVKIFRDVDTETTSLVATIGERLKKFEREEKHAPKESTPKPEVQQAKPAAPALQKEPEMQTAKQLPLMNGKDMPMHAPEPQRKAKKIGVDAITRHRVWVAIESGLNAGKTPGTIHGELVREGLTHTDGQPILLRWVMDICDRVRLGGLANPAMARGTPKMPQEAPKHPVAAITPLPVPQNVTAGQAKGEGPGLKSTVLSILTDPTMSDAKKIRVLTAMLED